MLFPCWGDESPSLANHRAILDAFNLTEKSFVLFQNLVVNVQLVDHFKAARVEGSPRKIDSPEEFITAAFFTAVPLPKKTMSVLQRELPYSDVGALRLYSLWKRKMAVAPKSSRKYKVIIEKISALFKLSSRDVDRFYSQALESYFMAMAKKTVGDWFDADDLYPLIHPILSYYKNPHPDNATTIYERILQSAAPTWHRFYLKAERARQASLTTRNERIALGILNTLLLRGIQFKPNSALNSRVFSIQVQKAKDALIRNNCSQTYVGMVDVIERHFAVAMTRFYTLMGLVSENKQLRDQLIKLHTAYFKTLE